VNSYEVERIMTATHTQWQISGDYFENCNCDLFVPLSCWFRQRSPDGTADTGRL